MVRRSSLAAALFLSGGMIQLLGQAVPTISLPLVPETKPPGARGFVLTVNGSGFTDTSVVAWNGHARKTTFVSQTQLTANIPAADLATPSTVTVKVVTPGEPKRISNPALFEITTSEAEPSFTPSMLSVSGTPVLSDLNGDGLPDLVTWNRNYNTENIVVALATGPGVFGTGQVYSVPGTVATLLTGDFNGDGRPDIAAATTSGVEILYNTGAGNFAGPRPAAHVYYTSLAAGDLNGDGRLDLVGGWQSPPYNVQVILRNAGGGFDAPVPYPAVSPMQIAIADLNRDGVLDLALANEDDSISVLLGNGDGTFQPQAVYQTGSTGDFPTAILAADFNGDGIPDIVRSCAYFTAAVGILLGNGDGTFQPVTIYGSSSYGMAAGDFNGDGKLDLAVGANATDAGILFGNGDGTFQPVLYFYYGLAAFSPAAADFNQNGRLDLLLATDSTIQMLVQ